MTKFKNILIVEDDIFISELYTRSLKRAGYEVTLAPTGPDGLRMGKSGEYDLMLLDIMMPGMIGVDVLKALREKEDQAPHMKIVITTNLDQDDESRADVERLADGYIIKADITPKRLVEMIHEIEEIGSLPVEEEKRKG